MVSEHNMCPGFRHSVGARVSVSLLFGFAWTRVPRPEGSSPQLTAIRLLARMLQLDAGLDDMIGECAKWGHVLCLWAAWIKCVFLMGEGPRVHMR